MNRKIIAFTKINTAELIESEMPPIGDNDVVIKTYYSTISAGTEKANITGDLNVSIMPCDPADTVPHFPRFCGYSTSGIVCETGKAVTKFKVGDRVVPSWSNHTNFNVCNENKVAKLADNVSLSEASTVMISTFPLAAVRKVRIEAGESALVMGLGILGSFAVHQLRALGAYPIIAADPVKSRRDYALTLGADFSLDPFDPDFASNVKQLTGGKGVDAAIEVTGVGKALDTTLDCMAHHGRIALLGCTRDKNFTIDYYRKIHGPGIQLFGAHTLARPQNDSSPGYFTQIDDIKAVIKLISGGRFNHKLFINEKHPPEKCGEVFSRLVNDKDFPLGVQFEWCKE